MSRNKYFGKRARQSNGKERVNKIYHKGGEELTYTNNGEELTHHNNGREKSQQRTFSAVSMHRLIW